VLRRVFFRPQSGWVGDVIPVESEGELRLFYLHELRESPKPGTSWALTRTRDLVTFADEGISLPHGDETDPDFNAYTGSVVIDQAGTHHLFYTAQNPGRLGADGLPVQLVAHATSEDGTRGWVKHPEHTFGAPAGYETADFRDPFVFRDEEQGAWRMLVAARHDSGPQRRRGVIAQLVSADLVDWTPAPPFWDPRRYITHECPEVFRLGEWWYLLYSEFSDAFVTRYRMARSLDGPWIAPDRDTVDGRAFYAAKSADLGGRRIFAGWIATREGDSDDGAWQWAGTLSLLEATQNPDGSLAFALPDEIVDSFTDPVALDLEPGGLAAVDGYACLVSNGALPRQCYLRAELDVDPGTAEAGLLLRTSPDGDEGYVLRLEPKRSRMVLDRWPRTSTGDAQWQISGDVPHFIELERPADLTGPTHTIEIVLEDDIAVVVLDRQVCLSTRLHDHTHNRLGIFVGDGTAKLRDLTLRQRPASPDR
jgi:beta-fructofuranosidase